MLANNETTQPNDDAFELVPPQDTLDVTPDDTESPSSALNSPSLAPPRLVRQQSEDFVVLKVERPDAPGGYRRFLVDHPSQTSAYETLKANVAAAFPTLGAQAFHFHFRDNEGDLCVISSDVELAEAIQVTVREQAKSLKVQVALHVSTPQSSSAASSPPVAVLAAPTPPASPTTASTPDDALGPTAHAEPVVSVPDVKATTPRAQATPASADPHCLPLPAPVFVTPALAPAVSAAVNTGLRHRVLPSRMNGKARVIITPVPAPKVPETKHARSVGPATFAFACSHCHAKVVNGTRFSCTVCPAFHLCVTCEAKDVHPATHPLTKTKALPAPPPPSPADVHVGVTCDACGVSPIQGVRFKCQVCPDFDLCAACEATDAHPADHALYKLRVSNAASRLSAPASPPQPAPVAGFACGSASWRGQASPQHVRQQAWTSSCPLFRCGPKLLLLPLLVLLLQCFSCVAKPLALIAILRNVFQAARSPSQSQSAGCPCGILTFFVLSWILGGYGRAVLGMLALAGLAFLARCAPSSQPAAPHFQQQQQPPQTQPFWIPARFFRRQARCTGNPTNTANANPTAHPERQAPAPQPQAPQMHQAPHALPRASPQPAAPQPAAAAFPAQPLFLQPGGYPGFCDGAVSNVSEVDAAVFAEQLQLLSNMGFGARQDSSVSLLKQFGGNVNHVVNCYMDQRQ